MLVRNLCALRWILSARGAASLAMVLGGGLGAASWLCQGGFVAEWWLGTTVLVLAGWCLAPSLIARTEGEARQLLAQSAAVLAPLALALGWVLVQYTRVPYVFGILCESVALGSVIGVAAHFWLVPLLQRLPRPVVRLATSALPIILLVILWTVTYSVISVGAWWNLEPSVGDTAVFEQAIYNTLQGRFLYYSGDLHYPFPVSRFADHFDPILLLFVPLWALWPTGLWLLLAQVGLLASGAIPVARIARRWYGLPAAGLPFAAAYLLHPGLHSALLYEFHPEVLAAPLIVWGVALGLERRYLGSSLFLLAAICCKENIPGVICLVGLLLAYKGHRRYGVTVTLAALVCGLIIIKVVFPYFSPLGHTPNADILDDVRRTRFLTGHDPQFTYLQSRLSYLLEVTGPVLGLCFLAPVAMATSLSELGLHLLSRSRLMNMVAAHYHVTITVGVVLGGIAGLTWLAKCLETRLARDNPKKRDNLRRAILLGFAAGLAWEISHGPNLLTCQPFRSFHRPPELVQRQRQLLAKVPDEASVLLNAGELLSPLCRRLRIGNRMKPVVADDVVLRGCREFEYVALKVPLTSGQAEAISKRYGLRLLGHEGDIWLWQVARNERRNHSQHRSAVSRQEAMAHRPLP